MRCCFSISGIIRPHGVCFPTSPLWPLCFTRLCSSLKLCSTGSTSAEGCEASPRGYICPFPFPSFASPWKERLDISSGRSSKIASLPSKSCSIPSCLRFLFWIGFFSMRRGRCAFIRRSSPKSSRFSTASFLSSEPSFGLAICSMATPYIPMLS